MFYLCVFHLSSVHMGTVNLALQLTSKARAIQMAVPGLHAARAQSPTGP